MACILPPSTHWDDIVSTGSKRWRSLHHDTASQTWVTWLRSFCIKVASKGCSCLCQTFFSPLNLEFNLLFKLLLNSVASVYFWGGKWKDWTPQYCITVCDRGRGGLQYAECIKISKGVKQIFSCRVRRSRSNITLFFKRFFVILWKPVRKCANAHLDYLWKNMWVWNYLATVFVSLPFLKPDEITNNSWCLMLCWIQVWNMPRFQILLLFCVQEEIFID